MDKSLTLLNKLVTLFSTIRHLKATQIYHQLWYRIKAKLNIKDEGKVTYNNDQILKKQFFNYVFNPDSYLGDNSFCFINLQHQFQHIDWNYSANKKLWTYNLNYFDFLNQSSISTGEGLKLVFDFIDHYDFIKDGKEPYPTSLRLINLIRFILTNEIRDTRINELIALDTFRLSKNLEYHLLANHLLENAFALFFAGKYLQNQQLLKQAKRLLIQQLDEQILEDGAHYELSPMYHQLMLYRVLDCIQLCDPLDSIQKYLIQKAEIMLQWLRHVTFNNGDIPLVNDSAFGISPTTEALLNYSNQLNIQIKLKKLAASGYRMIKKDTYECFVDVGNPAPSYQPGHTHADSLSFILYIDNQPFIVDTGTSTYNIGKVRSKERSTQSHNTVVQGDRNSSEVWSGFRVGKRAHTSVLKETEQHIEASHNGYSSKHFRSWSFESNKIAIKDTLYGGDNVAYFHFHPNVKIEEKGKNYIRTNLATLEFEEHIEVKIQSYDFAPKFNTYIRSIKLAVSFKEKLKTSIII